MEEAPETRKESLHSAHANGMNENSTSYAQHACKTQADLHVLFDFNKLACEDQV
jgi:hypothetical protein